MPHNPRRNSKKGPKCLVGIDMQAAFLTGKKMRVKVRNILSTPWAVTGGTVHGSMPGALDHNAVMERVDSNFLTPCQKYVDDLTCYKTIPKNSLY